MYTCEKGSTRPVMTELANDEFVLLTELGALVSSAKVGGWTVWPDGKYTVHLLKPAYPGKLHPSEGETWLARCQQISRDLTRHTLPALAGVKIERRRRRCLTLLQLL